MRRRPQACRQQPEMQTAVLHLRLLHLRLLPNVLLAGQATQVLSKQM